jgi:hypothetical protein
MCFASVEDRTIEFTRLASKENGRSQREKTAAWDSPILSTHGAIRGQQTQHQTFHPSISRVGNLPG